MYGCWVLPAWWLLAAGGWWLLVADGIDAAVSTTVAMESDALASLHAGNRSDIWYSSTDDGTQWFKLQQQPPDDTPPT